MEQVIACTILLLAWSSVEAVSEHSCVDCVFIDKEKGQDSPACLQRNTSSENHCQTLKYVFENSPFLSQREVILRANHWLNVTLEVEGVSNLTLKSGENTRSVIECPHFSNSTINGFGFVFKNVSHLTIQNIAIRGCGSLQNSTTTREDAIIKYRSALYIVNSTNITLNETDFYQSVGKGLSMHDVDGVIEIYNSNFRENLAAQGEVFGGGSIYIEFTSCSPGELECDPLTNSHNKNSQYQIVNCTFENNVASNEEYISQRHIVQFSVFDGRNAGQGGGIHIIVRGSSFNNSISVDMCKFYNNSGVFGGGIDVLFLDHASNNSFVVNNSVFISNHAPYRGGGALQLGFYGVDTVTNNALLIKGSRFVNNTAGWGAAVAYFSSLSEMSIRNRIAFTDCLFECNAASFGAAIALKPSAVQSIHDGHTPTVLFRNCSFIKNKIVFSGAFLNAVNDGVSQQVLESGALDVTSSRVNFSEFILFKENNGSAVVANSGQINIQENTLILFKSNRATNGGAMALIGFSILELYPGSQVLFESNIASELGGAIFSTSPHQLEFIISHKCFISYRGEYSYNPDLWNTSLIFTNNTARYGSAIFTDSVLPCVKQIGSLHTNITGAFRWKSFRFSPGIENYTIATWPAGVNFTVPSQVSPGEGIYLNITAKDDLNQTIPSSFKVTLNSNGGEALTNAFVSEDGQLQIKGDLGVNFTLTLTTQNTRHISVTKYGSLDNCPVGFVLNGDTCICSVGTKQELVGIVSCDMTSFTAFLQVGYWIGCSNSKILTGVCPLSYCNYETATSSGVLPIPRNCEDIDICDEHRAGQLCGECKAGQSAYFHSEEFSCGKCHYGALGLLIYIVAELLPLIVVFLLVMIFKINITSGIAQSFLLFSQNLFIINIVPSFRPLSTPTTVLIKVHTLIVGFFNLYFFHMDEMSFCLWKGSTIMDTIAFRYTTTLFTILLLSLFILTINQNTINLKRLFKKFPSLSKKMKKNLRVRNNSVVHGITAFIILSYTQYTLTSLLIIERVPVYAEGGRGDQTVAYFQGNLGYFGPTHLIYAIPAILVLITFSLPPPLLLIAYPLLWKIKAKLRRKTVTENDTTIWPIRKLLPIIDSFQGVFKDRYRMFAGLIFLWKFILLCISSFSTTISEFLLLTVMALFIFFAIHTWVRPYKQQLHNIVDSLMLFNGAVITLLKWYTTVPLTGNIDTKVIEFVIFLKLFLMYLPLLCLGGFAAFQLLRLCNVLPADLFGSVKTWWRERIESNNVPNKKTAERRDASEDEDFFERAAELNRLRGSPFVTCTEAGIDANNTVSSTLTH